MIDWLRNMVFHSQYLLILQPGQEGILAQQREMKEVLVDFLRQTKMPKKYSRSIVGHLQLSANKCV